MRGLPRWGGGGGAAALREVRVHTEGKERRCIRASLLTTCHAMRTLPTSQCKHRRCVMQQLTSNVFVETQVRGCNHGFVTKSDGIEDSFDKLEDLLRSLLDPKGTVSG